MRIAFVLFDQVTALDFIGLYDPLTRLKTMNLIPDVSWELCAPTPQVFDDRGLKIVATQVGGTLKGFDLLVTPGGFGTRPLQNDPAYIDWLRTGEETPFKASVCTGALLYGAAGWLQGLRATTHPSAYELLRPYCREVVTDARVVDEGPVVTARGVTAALDLGLHLCERLVGVEPVRRMRAQMDYPYGV